MRRLGYILFAILICVSCSISRYVPEDKVLYNGVDIEFTEDAKLKDENKIRSAIESSIFPKPNRKLLGLVYFNLWVYFTFDESKDKWYAKFLYNRFAREPIYTEDVNISLVENLIKKEMQDEGYFNSEVEGEINNEEREGVVKYRVTPSRRTVMRSILRPSGDTEVDSLISDYDKGRIRERERYRLEAFEMDRNEIAEYLRSRGYYEFNADDIFYLVDTADIDSVDIIMKIKKPEGDSIHRKFYIGKVNAYTTNGALGLGKQDSSNFAFNYRDLNIYQDFRFIDKKTLTSNVLIDKGDVFSVQDYNLTLSRLINLNIFKYVNVQYEKIADDSLEVNILMTPTEYKGFQYDIEMNTSDRSFLGSALSVNFSNNNTFRKAEKLTLGLAGSTELQYFGANLGFSILSVNASAKYEVPRLLVPFKTREFRSSVAPKTILSVSDQYELWLQYFDVNTFKAHYGYEWKTENRYNFTLQPLFFDYVNVFRTTELFDSTALANPLLGLRFTDQLNLGANFTLGHTNRLDENQRNSYVLRWSVETSGNTSTLFFDSITQVPIAQYFRTDFEYRFIRKFNPIENFVFRVNAGIVRPYGNSRVAPFTKQFYMGGPTTLRGFQFNSVGPGRFRSANAGQTVNPIDQFGDIRLLMNVEYRFPIYSVFRGATFFDVGNIWLLDDGEDRPEGVFRWDEFYKEFAWNTGFGLRMDFDFFAVRLDLGIPLYTPFASEGERWIHQSPERSLVPWVRENMVLSAGIGYPF